MQLQFTKMVQFSLLVKTGDRLREFNFRKLRGPEDALTVNVCDDRGNRIVFTMQRSENSWRVVSTGLPSWILQHENQLHQAVEEELSKW